MFLTSLILPAMLLLMPFGLDAFEHLLFPPSSETPPEEATPQEAARDLPDHGE
ncbi:hypothetical protein ACFYN3_28250 [Streptomyces lavendulae]|uniref:hypothetical protein n=1 Tax=Streptomyces lavendulae TaxID=1914 RepID=UPI003687DC5A